MGAYYRAKASCRIGGAFRKAGDIFYFPRFEIIPPYLEEIAPGKAETLLEAPAPAGDEAGLKPRKKNPRPTPPGPGPEDFR